MLILALCAFIVHPVFKDSQDRRFALGVLLAETTDEDIILFQLEVVVVGAVLDDTVIAHADTSHNSRGFGLGVGLFRRLYTPPNCPNISTNLLSCCPR